MVLLHDVVQYWQERLLMDAAPSCANVPLRWLGWQNMDRVSDNPTTTWPCRNLACHAHRAM